MKDKGIPRDWSINKTPRKKKDGISFYRPGTNKADEIRIMPGKVSSPHSGYQRPYVRWKRDGKQLDKNDVPSTDPTKTHIPLDEFKFQDQDKKLIDNIEISKNIRNLIIEALIMISSKDLQLSYQKKVQVADVSAEIFCLWEDSYCLNGDIFRQGFSKSETNSLKKFNSIFEEVCDASPEELPTINEVVKTEYWKKYSEGACEALKVFPEKEVENIKLSMIKDYS